MWLGIVKSSEAAEMLDGVQEERRRDDRIKLRRRGAHYMDFSLGYRLYGL